MPIYEYRCGGCRRRVSVFQRSITSTARPRCPECDSVKLTRLMSRFAHVRGEEALLDSLDDASLMSGVDESDPRSVAEFARKMGSRFGGEMGEDFQQAVEEMEAGEGLDGDDDGPWDEGDF